MSFAARLTVQSILFLRQASRGVLHLWRVPLIFSVKDFTFLYNCKHINSFNLLEFFENYEFLRRYFSDFDFRSRVICKIGLYIDMQHISIFFTRVCSLEHLSMAASNVLMIFKKTSFSNMQ